MALLFAATYPERVQALVLYGSLPRFVRGPNFPWLEPKHEYLAEYEAEAERWGSQQNARDWLEWNGMENAPEALADRARKDRLLISPGAFLQLGRMNAEIDVRPVLPTIRVPTLVMHRPRELAWDVRHSRYLAKHIPGARYVELEGTDADTRSRGTHRPLSLRRVCPQTSASTGPASRAFRRSTAK